MSIKRIIQRFLSEGTILKYHKIRAKSAASLFRYPGASLKVIGVTGTDGKTTTCHLIASILRQAGCKVAMATTIDFQIGDQVVKNKKNMTTVDPYDLQKFLHRAAKEKCIYAILEISAHAISQYRIWGIPFEAAVLTNVTHDHLDYFKTFTKYRLVKEKLFAKSPYVSVINADDPSAVAFLKHTTKSQLTYAIHSKADYVAKKILYGPDRVSFTIIGSHGQTPIFLNIPGKFNVYNALAAAAFAFSQHIPIDRIKSGLLSVKGIAGRMESIDSGQNFTVLIDFAHTPEALQNAYQTIKNGTKGKLIAVLGSAGNHDKTKRPLLGEIAAHFADNIIFTNEDPHTEDPESIIDQIASGLTRSRKPKTKYKKSQFKIFKTKSMGEGEWWWRISDRREAIRQALLLATSGDVVIITGKGAEETMAVGDKRIPWSDRKVTEELIKELLKTGDIRSRSLK
ncbi:MAG: UDP-N-acetylmuramoyl-L-alanyl-D-glutamate--2,6-diaminopimelate ligase [bacterium]|nr:UDP-N-acetylmuramoyl-L-alanyl-D-glutamate--2,6-diaminopimelate ligase [bacterium]